MTSRHRTLTILGLITLIGLAIALWQLGLDGANQLVGLVGATIAIVGALAGLVVPGPAPTGAPEAQPGPATPRSPGRRNLVFSAAAVAATLVIAGGLILHAVTARDDPAAISPTPSTPSAPIAGATASAESTSAVEPSRTIGTTGHPATSGATPPTTRITTAAPSQPWLAPAGTPEWTLYDTDAITFLPKPVHQSATGFGDLIFQLNMHQVSWYQWTDSTDLSYAGCRSDSATRWDGLKLDLFDAPRTYCRREPSDPTVVSYVQFTAKDMDASPAYVKVKVWIYRPS